LGGGTAAANAKGEEHEACAASNTAAGENRLHREKMRSHFPLSAKNMVQVRLHLPQSSRGGWPPKAESSFPFPRGA